MLLCERDIDEMLALQAECARGSDLFLPTSREGYLRAFRFQNFCLGERENGDGPLNAFLNCSVPTARAECNWGRGRLPDADLDAVGHMNTLLIRRGHRRQGTGGRMVRAALERFFAAGCRHVYATADPENRGSLALLRAFGFRPVDAVRLQGFPRQLFYKRLAAAPGAGPAGGADQSGGDAS